LAAGAAGREYYAFFGVKSKPKYSACDSRTAERLFSRRKRAFVVNMEE
jgi:hypothetical protein